MLIWANHIAYGQKPNIIVIMADDMGYSDIGCYGSEIATPNLDKLAAKGLAMTQFYNASRCCPTRASLLTGLYPHQAGIGDMVNARPAPGYQGFLNKNSVTIAEALGASGGYRTYMAGKWHVGQKPENWPLNRGFEKFYGLIDGASSYFSPTQPYRPGQKLTLAVDSQSTSVSGEWYATDVYTDRALAYISDQSRLPTRPFFLYLAYTSPHWPLHALSDDIAKYKGKYKAVGWDSLRKARLEKLIKLGMLPKDTRLSPRDESLPAWESLSEKEKEEWDAQMAIYAGMVDRMDQNIGRVLDLLKKTGQEENTMIIFLSDNGASHEDINGKGFLPDIIAGSKKLTGQSDSFAAYGKSGANVSNTPFRSYKHWQYEGGIATPLIVSFPELLKMPLVVDKPGHVIDIMATCLDAAGVKYPSEFKGNEITATPGVSLLPLLRREKWKGHDDLFFEHEGNKAVRQGDWKLVSNFSDRKWQLYNMKTDRTETKDLSLVNSKRVADMVKLYEDWAKKSGVIPFEELLKAK